MSREKQIVFPHGSISEFDVPSMVHKFQAQKDIKATQPSKIFTGDTNKGICEDFEDKIEQKVDEKSPNICLLKNGRKIISFPDYTFLISEKLFQK